MTVACAATLVRVGGGAEERTVTVVVEAGLLSWPSFTTSEKTSVASADRPVGAVNEGVADVGSDSATEGPDVCVQA